MRRALLAATLLVVALTVTPLLVATGTQASCEPATGPGVSVASLDDQQMTNAATVIGVAIDRGLGRDGAVIGVMTALTESSLHNVARGDAAGPDSRGLFQQRSGWGPVEVRMRPAGAAALFYDLLVTVPGWTTMPPWQAAQAVQRSAFEDGSNYRANHDLAASVVDDVLVGSPKSQTARAVEGCGPAPIHDAGDTLPGSEQAVKRAHRLVGSTGYYQLCARLAANIWGRSHAGYASAADQWAVMVETGHARPRDTRPPVGALLFWDTGNVHGHVAVYVGAGDVVSNDIGDETPGTGGVYLVSAADFSSRWDATYLGWSTPVYP